MAFLYCCDCLQEDTENADAEITVARQEFARTEEPPQVRGKIMSGQPDDQQQTGSFPERIGYGFDGVFHTCTEELIIGHPQRPEGLHVDDLVRNVFPEMIEQIRRQHAQGSEIYIVTNTHGKDSPDVEKFLELVGLDQIIPNERRFYDAWEPLHGKAEYIAKCDMNEFYDDSTEVLRGIANMQRGGLLNSSVKLHIVFPKNSRTPNPVVESYVTQDVTASYRQTSAEIDLTAANYLLSAFKRQYQ